MVSLDRMVLRKVSRYLVPLSRDLLPSAPTHLLVPETLDNPKGTQ